MHFNAPFIYGMGPVVGAHTRRVAMRHAVEGFIANGVLAERMGLLLGFQSARFRDGGRRTARRTVASRARRGHGTGVVNRAVAFRAEPGIAFRANPLAADDARLPDELLHRLRLR